MYTNRSFEIPRCSAGPSRHPVATPRTSRKFFDAASIPLDMSQSSLDINDMHHAPYHVSHASHSTMAGIHHGLAPPTPVFSSKIHESGRHRRLGAALGVAYLLVGVVLASWALHHFVIESTHTLVTQLYLVANSNRNLRAMPASILLLSLATIVNACLAFSRKLVVRFVHFVLSLGLIGALVFVAVTAKRAEPQVEEFYRVNTIRQLQDDYGIVPEVTHSTDYIQVRFRCCGLHSPQDFDHSQWKRRGLNGRNDLPKTCYELRNQDIDDAALNPVIANSSSIHRQGCLSSVDEYLMWNSWEIVAVLCGTALFIAASMFLSCKYVR